MEAIIKFLCKEVEKCQAKGAFSLKDAYVLKDCVDLFMDGKSSNTELNQQNALDAIIQSLNIGQSKGCFSLTEAHGVFNSLQSLERMSKEQNEIPKESTEKITEI